MNCSTEEIPGDFPRSGHGAVVSGAQSKVLATRLGGEYRSESDVSTLRAFRTCEELALQLVAVCCEKASERGSQEAAVSAIFQGLLRKGWCTPEQAVWTMHRAVGLLGWPPAVLSRVAPPTGHLELTEAEARKLLRLDVPPDPRTDGPRSVVEVALAKLGVDWRAEMGIDKAIAETRARQAQHARKMGR